MMVGVVRSGWEVWSCESDSWPWFPAQSLEGVELIFWCEWFLSLVASWIISQRAVVYVLCIEHGTLVPGSSSHSCVCIGMLKIYLLLYVSHNCQIHWAKFLIGITHICFKFRFFLFFPFFGQSGCSVPP
jgi:hypothetical protein